MQKIFTLKVKTIKLTFTLTFYWMFSNFFNFGLQILLIFNIFDIILDMCEALKMTVISFVRIQKYYVIFKLLRNYWKATTHFSSII